MAMKQNLQQEVAASLMEEQQIIEDQQFGGEHDETRVYYIDYINKLEKEKVELEKAMAEPYEYLDPYEFMDDDDEDDESCDDEAC